MCENVGDMEAQSKDYEDSGHVSAEKGSHVGWGYRVGRRYTSAPFSAVVSVSCHQREERRV